MSTTNEKTISVLNDLIETCKDGSAGFRDAADNVTSGEFKTLFNELAGQRAQFAAELQGLVSQAGGKPETSGSVAGKLHRGWIDLKAAITSRDDHAILAECERGEDSAVASYKEALGDTEISQDVLGVIQTQYSAVQAAHDRVRALRDATV